MVPIPPSALLSAEKPSVGWEFDGPPRLLRACTTEAWYTGFLVDALTRISELLDRTDDETVGTSMRIPAAVREAAAVAVAELGVAPSTTALATDALRSRLEAIVIEAALTAHYDKHPEARPSLAELAIAAAELDGNPL